MLRGPGRTRLRADFINRITSKWQKTVQSVLEVGHLLLAAKAKLPHGDFIPMVETGGRVVQ
jgi:hypothetical protein